MKSSSLCSQNAFLFADTEDNSPTHSQFSLIICRKN